VNSILSGLSLDSWFPPSWYKDGHRQLIRPIRYRMLTWVGRCTRVGLTNEQLIRLPILLFARRAPRRLRWRDHRAVST
jgi:hypothetical protein